MSLSKMTAPSRCRRRGRSISATSAKARADPNFTLEGVLPTLTQRAVQYISQQTKAHPDRPFFLYFASNAPHTPVAPTAPFRERARRRLRRLCRRSRLDGRADSGALDEQKVADNTLLIFTSDNGPEITAYRGRSSSAITAWATCAASSAIPGKEATASHSWRAGRERNPAGSASDQIICQTDLMATLATIIGAKLPPNAGEDSYNILPRCAATISITRSAKQPSTTAATGISRSARRMGADRPPHRRRQQGTRLVQAAARIRRTLISG